MYCKEGLITFLQYCFFFFRNGLLDGRWHAIKTIQESGDWPETGRQTSANDRRFRVAISSPPSPEEGAPEPVCVLRGKVKYLL